MLMGDYDAIASSGETGEMPHRIVLHCHMARLTYNWLVAGCSTDYAFDSIRRIRTLGMVVASPMSMPGMIQITVLQVQR